jgi:hypothetical protein
MALQHFTFWEKIVLVDDDREVIEVIATESAR